MDGAAPYHIILGRAWLHMHKAVASTYHQCVKAIWKGKEVTIPATRTRFDESETHFFEAASEGTWACLEKMVSKLWKQRHYWNGKLLWEKKKKKKKRFRLGQNRDTPWSELEGVSTLSMPYISHSSLFHFFSSLASATHLLLSRCSCCAFALASATLSASSRARNLAARVGDSTIGLSGFWTSSSL